MLKFNHAFVIVRGLKPDDPNFWSRLIGMAVVSLLLGFVIGTGLGFVFYVFVSNMAPVNLTLKKSMWAGGVFGALCGPLILVYFIF
jgi:Mg/Co/Ni transporter MgtE